MNGRRRQGALMRRGEKDVQPQRAQRTQRLMLHCFARFASFAVSCFDEIRCRKVSAFICVHLRSSAVFYRRQLLQDYDRTRIARMTRIHTDNEYP
jgi:hypothetical protein